MPSLTPASSSSSVARKAGSTVSASRTSSRVKSSAASAAGRAIGGHGMIEQAEAQAGQLEGDALAAAALDAVGRGSGRLLSHWRHTPGAAAVAIIEPAPHPAAALDDGSGSAVQRGLEIQTGVGGA